MHSIYDNHTFLDWCAGHFESRLLLGLKFDLKVVLESFDACQSIQVVHIKALLHSSVLRVLLVAGLSHQLFFHLQLLSRNGLFLELRDQSTLPLLALFAPLLNLLSDLVLVHGTQFLFHDHFLHFVNHSHFGRFILTVKLVDLLQQALFILLLHRLQVSLDLFALLIILYFAVANLSVDTLSNSPTLLRDAVALFRRVDQLLFLHFRVSSLFVFKCLFEFAIVESVSLLSPNLYGLKISLLFG